MTRWEALINQPKASPLLMGVLNVSPESFHGASVAVSDNEIAARIRQLESEGADLIDIGAKSTAPYLRTSVPLEIEVERMRHAVRLVRSLTQLPISADTASSEVAEAALMAGADAVNDVTGLIGDPAMAPLLAEAQCGAIAMAWEMPGLDSAGRSVPETILSIFRKITDRAAHFGIPDSRLVLDPGVGFFRNREMPWWEWDIQVIRAIPWFQRRLRLPLLVGASRKSFLGHLLGRTDTQDRLAGSIATAIWLANQGVQILRVHDVGATRDALLVTRWMEDEQLARPVDETQRIV